MKTKILSLIIACAMALTMLPMLCMNAFAADKNASLDLKNLNLSNPSLPKLPAAPSITAPTVTKLDTGMLEATSKRFLSFQRFKNTGGKIAHYLPVLPEKPKSERGSAILERMQVKLPDDARQKLEARRQDFIKVGKNAFFDTAIQDRIKRTAPSMIKRAKGLTNILSDASVSSNTGSSQTAVPGMMLMPSAGSDSSNSDVPPGQDRDISGPGVYFGTIEQTGEMDSFKLTLAQEGDISIILTMPTGMDSYLMVFNEIDNAHFPVNSQPQELYGIKFYNFSIAAGTHYICIYQYNSISKDNYRLELNFAPKNYPNPGEPDDYSYRYISSTPASISSVIEGDLDMDSYVFYVPEGDFYRLSLTEQYQNETDCFLVMDVINEDFECLFDYFTIFDYYYYPPGYYLVLIYPLFGAPNVSYTLDIDNNFQYDIRGTGLRDDSPSSIFSYSNQNNGAIPAEIRNTGSYEPNDHDPKPVAVPGSISSTLEYYEDIDLYTFTVPGVDAYRFNLANCGDELSVNIYEVYNGQWFWLDTVNSWENTQKSVILYPGINYGISIVPYIDGSAFNYTLSIAGTDIYEGNDWYDRAYSIDTGVYRGLLPDVNDVDIFKFTVTEEMGSGMLKAVLDLPDGVDADLYVEDSRYLYGLSERAGYGASEAVSCVLDRGEYYIVVFPYAGYDDDEYSLNISFSPGGIDPYEPNDGRAYNVTVPFATEGAAIETSPNTFVDVDQFAFDVTYTGLYQIRLTGHSANLDLYLEDSTGKQIASSRNDGDFHEEFIEMPLQPGRYTVRVEGYNRGDASDYMLSIRKGSDLIPQYPIINFPGSSR